MAAATATRSAASARFTSDQPETEATTRGKVAPTSDVSVVISAFPSSPSTARFATELCVGLCLYGTAAHILPTLDPGQRKSFRDRLRSLQVATVYMPVIDAYFLHYEPCILELYHALRSSLLTGQPIVVPVLDSGLDGFIAGGDDGGSVNAGVNEQGPGGGTASSRQISPQSPLALSTHHVDILAQLRATCATLRTDGAPKEAALRTINLLVHLDITLPSLSAGAGAPLSTVYSQRFALVSSHRPNSGCMKILKGIVNPASCTELCLKGLFIASLGCEALAGMLRMIPMMSLLDLTDNGVGNTGVAALCRSLALHPSLTALKLGGNDISIAGSADVLQLTQVNSRILDVDLSGNPIDSAVWLRRVATQLNTNRSASVAEHDATNLLCTIPSESRFAPTHAVKLRASFASNGVMDVTAVVSTAGAEKTFQFTATAQQRQGALGKLAKSSTSASSSPDAAVLAQLVDKTASFVSGGLITKSITITRLNGKSLKFVLESAVGGAEELARLCLQCLSLRAGCPDQIRNAAARGSAAIAIDLVLSADTQPEPTFIQCNLTLWRDRVIAKSLTQIFRGKIYKYCGHIVEEVLAVLDAFTMNDGGESVAISTLSRAHQQEEEQERAYESQVSSSVVAGWAQRSS